jgi:hypothetical protein
VGGGGANLKVKWRDSALFFHADSESQWLTHTPEDFAGLGDLSGVFAPSCPVAGGRGGPGAVHKSLPYDNEQSLT